jgi:hypothetical protein
MILSSLTHWLFGGGMEKVSHIADKAFHTEQEKAEEDATDLASARAMPAISHDTLFDVMVDGINRLQRPGWGVYLFGGVIGWWAFPELASDSLWASLFILYFTFLFGGRALLKDLPSAINMMRGK